MGVCYWLPDQEKREDEALCRQTGVVSDSHVLVLMEHFNHPSDYWRGNTAKHKQSWSFLERVDDNTVSFFKWLRSQV